MTMSELNFRDHVYLAVIPVLMTEDELGTNIIDWSVRATDIQELASRIADTIAEARKGWDEDA